MTEDKKLIDLTRKEVDICSDEMRKIVKIKRETADVANSEDLFTKGSEILLDMGEFNWVDMLPVLHDFKVFVNNLYNINYQVEQKMIAALMLDKGLISQHDYECNSFLLEYDFDGEGNAWFDVVEHCPCNMQDRKLKEPIIIEKNYKYVRTWLVTLHEKIVSLDEWSEWEKSSRHW